MTIRLILLFSIMLLNACSTESSDSNILNQIQSTKHLQLALTPQTEKGQISTVLKIIELRFNKEIDSASLTKEKITIEPAVNFHIDTSRLKSDNVLTLLLEEKLQSGTTYLFNIDNIKDALNGELSSFNWNYKTRGNLNTSNFILQSSSPSHLATNVSDRLLRIKLSFNKNIALPDKSNISITPFIPGEVSVTDNELFYTFNTPLKANQYYSLTTTGITSLSGNAIDEFSITFQTGKDTILPSASVLTINSGVNSDSLSLNWSASQDAEGIDSYKIKRGTSTQNLTTIETLNAETFSFIDTNLNLNTNYIYQLTSIDKSGNARKSNLVSVKTNSPIIAIDSTPPVAGTLSLNKAPTITSINLKWLKGSDNVAIVEYKIYRSVNNATRTLLGTVLVNPVDNTQTFYYADKTVTDGTSYTYQVEALDQSNNSALSNRIMVNTPVAPLPVTANKTLTISWRIPTKNTDNSCLNDLKAYRLEYKSLNGSYTLLDEIDINSLQLSCQLISTDTACGTNIKTCSYTTPPLNSGTWSFRTQAINTNGLASPYSNEGTATIN